MASFLQFVLLCYLLQAFTTSQSTSTGYPLADNYFACDHKVRVTFANYVWTSEMGNEKAPRDIVEDEFFVSMMENVIANRQGRGMNCTFERTGFELTCCVTGNEAKFQSVDKKKKLEAVSSFWTGELTTINLVWFIVNCLLFMLTSAWELVLLFGCGYNLDSMDPFEESESIEM